MLTVSGEVTCVTVDVVRVRLNVFEERPPRPLAAAAGATDGQQAVEAEAPDAPQLVLGSAAIASICV
jgi:hypothetical protein